MCSFIGFYAPNLTVTASQKSQRQTEDVRTKRSFQIKQNLNTSPFLQHKLDSLPNFPIYFPFLGSLSENRTAVQGRLRSHTFLDMTEQKRMKTRELLSRIKIF